MRPASTAAGGICPLAADAQPYIEDRQQQEVEAVAVVVAESENFQQPDENLPGSAPVVAA
jgi:hypothetical protein